MTALAGATLTFDTEALKESLGSVIWDLFPMDTYFQNHVAKEKVSQTQHQWLYDSLAAPANNKQLQGDAVTATTLATAIRVSNYTQIARKVISVSGSHEASDTVGGSAMGRAVMKSMKEYKR